MTHSLDSYREFADVLNDMRNLKNEVGCPRSLGFKHHITVNACTLRLLADESSQLVNQRKKAANSINPVLPPVLVSTAKRILCALRFNSK